MQAPLSDQHARTGESPRRRPLARAREREQQERAVWISESNADPIRLERKARPLDGLRFRRRSSVGTLAIAQAQLPKRQGAGAAAARFNIQLRRDSTHSAESDKDGAHPVKEAGERRESITPAWLHGGRRRNSKKQDESGTCTVHASDAILGGFKADDITVPSANPASCNVPKPSLQQMPITLESCAVASFVPPQPTAPRPRPLSHISLRGIGTNSTRRSSSISVSTSTYSSRHTAATAAGDLPSPPDSAGLQVISLGHISEDVDVDALSAELDRLARLVGPHDLPLSPPLSPTRERTAEPECLLSPEVQWREAPPLLSPPLSAGSTGTSASTDHGIDGANDELQLTPRARQRRWKELHAGDPALCDPLWSQGARVTQVSGSPSSAAMTFCKPDRLVPRAPIPRSSPLYRRESWESGVSSQSLEDSADWHGGEGHQTLFREDGQRMAVLPDSDKGQRRRLISLAEALSAAELDEPEEETPVRKTPDRSRNRVSPPPFSTRVRALSSRGKDAPAAERGRRTVSAPSSPSPSPSSLSARPALAQGQNGLHEAALLPPSSSPQRISGPMVPISDWLDGQGDTSDESDPVAALRTQAGVPYHAIPGVAHGQTLSHMACRSPSAGSMLVQMPAGDGAGVFCSPGRTAELKVEVPAMVASDSAVPLYRMRASEEDLQAEGAAAARSPPQVPRSASPIAATIPSAVADSPTGSRGRAIREPRVSALPAPSFSRVKSPGARVRFADG